MKILEGSYVFILMYYNPDDDDCICEVYANEKQAREECRRRNKDYVDHECLTEEGDFDHNHYDSADFDYYDVVKYQIIV